MKTPPDVVTRLAQLQKRKEALRLFALVDGTRYLAQFGEPCIEQVGIRSLFTGTPDAALAHAGPWLVDAEQVGPMMVDALATLERAAPAVTWLIASPTLESLVRLLQLKLNTVMPDGRIALLRFWDPRVLINLAELLEHAQREVFFGDIDEWHLLHHGQRTWIGSRHAHA